MSYEGPGINVGDILQWNGSAYVPVPLPSGGGTQEHEIIPVAQMSGGTAINSGTTRFVAGMFVAPASFSVASMACITVTNNAGTFAMGIYDVSGNRLGQSLDIAIPATPGVVNVPLTAPVALVAGTQYYAAITSRANGAQFLRTASAYTGGVVPNIWSADQNGNPGSQMRATFNPAAGGNAQRYWMRVLA